MDQRKLPSEHEAIRLKRDVSEAERVAEEQRQAALLRRSLDWLLKQELGRVVWAHLFKLCGWNKTSLSRKMDGDVSVLSTECKEAQRLVYMEMRKLAEPELLMAVEFEAEFGSELAARMLEKLSKDKNKKGE